MTEQSSVAALAAVIDIAADAVIVLDQTFHITRFNRGAEQIFGWTEADMLGEPLDRLLPSAARDVHRVHMRAFAEGPQPSRRMGERRSITGVRRDGREFPADASIARVTVDGARSYMVVLRDVSERKRTEDGQRLLALAGWVLAGSLDLESTLATIVELPLPQLGDWSVLELLTEDGRVQRVSAAHADATQSAAVHPLVMRAPVPLPLELPAGSAARVALEGETTLLADADAWLRATFPDEAARVAAQGLGACEVLVAPLRAGSRTIGALSLVRSPGGARFTPDDRALADQYASSAALAYENARLYQESRAAVRERDELLAIVSHDLRNPVNAIVMLTGALMAQSDAGAPVPVDLEQLQAMRGAARQADGLIQDLQDVSRIAAGRLRIDARPCELREAVEECVDLFEPTADAAGLSLTCTAPPSLPRALADATRVQQVLSNLLVNAIKFTPEGGRITVTMSAGDGHVTVAVQDTGPGIAAEDVPRLFERYWQAPRLLRAGSGLGLFIAKGIIEAHGGEITVDTAPTIGTTFRFTVPIAA